jgi:16S rRNA (guanine527-N7)-methyltransferase
MLVKAYTSRYRGSNMMKSTLLPANLTPSELEALLPADLPNRERVASAAARHLELLAGINQVMNLTRITTPRDAAIKHILDSVMPWTLFAGAKSVLDAGTGAGFPGLPLALALPDTRFTLAESTGKKARFVESVIADLNIRNASVLAERVEDIGKRDRFEIVTARAFAPMPKALKMLAPLLKKGTRALLYKGPGVEAEIAEAARGAESLGVAFDVVMRYELPDGLGTRSIVQIAK